MDYGDDDKGLSKKKTPFSKFDVQFSCEPLVPGGCQDLESQRKVYAVGSQNFEFVAKSHYSSQKTTLWNHPLFGYNTGWSNFSRQIE